MNGLIKKIGVVALSVGLVFTGTSMGTAEAGKSDGTGKGKTGWVEKENKKIENVIYMIPDGFNADYATNYRMYKGENAIWDQHLKGMYTTHSANSNITDSAAAGTAMATGEKTNNGMISVDTEGNELETILEASQQEDMSTGLVATSTITHATPAVFASHVDNRDDETEIAKQMVANEVDVLLGGGKNNFLPESEGGNQVEVNLLEQAREQGYEFIETRDALQKNIDIDVERGDKLLGLFADDALSPEMHRTDTEEPSLADMTESAIDVLEEDKDGFFLMVEGSQIDWAGHANDAAWAMNEVEAFEEAVEKAIEFAEKDGKTLVVIGGDHETGGMTVGANGSSDANPELLKNVTATGDHMASKLNKERSNANEVIETYTDFELTKKEARKIQQADNTANAINSIISDRASIGWTSSNHTGVANVVYAYGPKSDQFSGFHDNTDLPKIITDAADIKLGE